jgi:hypothetical protein
MNSEFGNGFGEQMFTIPEISFSIKNLTTRTKSDS